MIQAAPLTEKLDAHFVKRHVAFGETRPPDGIVLFRSERVWVAIDWPHWCDVEWIEHKQNIRVAISEYSCQRCASVEVVPIVPAAQACPLLLVRNANNGRFRPIGCHFECLPGQQPAGANAIVDTLAEQMKLGAECQQFALETQCDSCIGQVRPESARDVSVWPGHFTLVLAYHAGCEQHVKQVHVTRTGGGMVVVDPPRTP